MAGEDHSLVAREPGRETVVEVGGQRIGGDEVAIIGGAPAAASPEQALAIARALAQAGATMLHDGTTSQTDPWHTPAHDRLPLIAELRRVSGLPVAAAVMDIRQLDAVLEVADAVQLAAFQMQNYTLLRELGETDRAVLLRRGSTNTLDELLSAAEYILDGGNGRVMLCERGIRTFERAYDATVDFTAIPLLQQRTHLPVLIDPSAAHERRWVEALSVAAVAAGADGVVVELSGEVGQLCERLRQAAAVVRGGAA